MSRVLKRGDKVFEEFKGKYKCPYLRGQRFIVREALEHNEYTTSLISFGSVFPGCDLAHFVGALWFGKLFP